jgi:membrane protease YdiL (CAAX protease family)
MPSALSRAPAVEWRLRDLSFAGLLSLAFMIPLTYAFLPLLLRGKWHQIILGVALEAAAVLPAVLLVARWRGARHLRQFGLGRYPWQKGLLLGLAGGAGLFLLTQGCGGLMQACGARMATQGILAETVLKHPGPGRLALFLAAAALIAPVWEEVFFRGLAYPVLRRSLGPAAGVLLSALLFAMLHAEPILFRLPIFLLGSCLAVFYELAGSLYVPIVAHATANVLSTMLAYWGIIK